MSEPNQSPLRHRHLLLAGLVPSFYFVEWLLVATTATVFSWLHHLGCSQTLIWLLFWAGNLLLSAAFITCNDLLQVDMTLMQGLRRLTDAAQRRTRFAGLLLELAICIRLLIWDGPCQLLIFVRNRLPSTPLRVTCLVVASGIQMFLWTGLYTLGYDSLGELFTHLHGGLP